MHACRPEDRDRLPDGRERVETFHELGQDAERAPRIGVQECGTRARCQEPLVLGSGVNREHRRGLGTVRNSTASTALVVGPVGVSLGRRNRHRALGLRGSRVRGCGCRRLRGSSLLGCFPGI